MIFVRTLCLLSLLVMSLCHAAPELRAPLVLPSAEKLSTPFPEKPLSVELATRLDAAFAFAQQHPTTRAPLMAAAVALPSGDDPGLWTSTLAADSAQPSAPLFYWASAGKTFTAVLILQLVEEKNLSLTDTLDRWFPKYPHTKTITIHHLLTHTSGIYSWQEDPQIRASKKPFTPTELVTRAAKHPNLFPAGSSWSYSNTGYTLLGLIIEKLDARPYAESIRARITAPLGLSHTQAATLGQPEPTYAKPHPKNPAEAQAQHSLAQVFSAGSITAPAEEMLRFWHGLLSGKLLSRATVEKMFSELHPMFGQRVTCYGQGVMVTDLPDAAAPDTWLGHSGGMPGLKTEVIYSVETGAFVAVALNSDASAQSVVNLLLKTLRGLPLPPSPTSPARP